MEVFAPSCNFLLQWTGKHGSEVTRLKATVMILGTTKQNASFIIFHDPQSAKTHERSRNEPKMTKKAAVSKRPELVSYKHNYK